MKKNGFKNIFTVFGFELNDYFKSKSFIISTIIICVIAIGIMFVPRIVDTFKGEDKITEGVDDTDAENADEEDSAEIFGLYDPNGVVPDEIMKQYFGPGYERYTDEASMKKEIEDETLAGGFYVSDIHNFKYFVLNKSISDSNQNIFTEMLADIVRINYCNENNLDIEKYMEAQYPEINATEDVLGKDSGKNFWYCYGLVIIVFMLIIMYGTSIATSVTSEKSNRSVEVLVTSTPAYSILFGKVFAGAVAAIFQSGLIIASVIGGYQFNKDYWGDTMSMVLNIPGDVLLTFALFGIGGFLFYAFLYGALGALVSKTEDLNKSAGSAQMIIMLVYFVVLFNFQNVDGIIMKVVSYLPISSYSAMFTRVAMGSVNLFEIAISLVLLYGSVVLMGLFAGKIYRNSTLRYGNPIKLSHAIKALRKSED